MAEEEKSTLQMIIDKYSRPGDESGGLDGYLRAIRFGKLTEDLPVEVKNQEASHKVKDSYLKSINL